MRILNAMNCFPINIGHRGENGVTQIRFQIPPDLLTWSYTVYVRRPGEVDSYPAANIARQDGSIVWTVSDVDTGNAGKGEVQIRYTSGTNKEKTMVYPTFTDKSIDMSPGDIPDAYETWLDALTEMAEETHTNAENAAASEANAKTSEDNAKWYAERSADAGGFAWFEVNNETGELMVTVTDKLAEDVSFAVNKELGTLEVTVS